MKAAGYKAKLSATHRAARQCHNSQGRCDGHAAASLDKAGAVSVLPTALQSGPQSRRDSMEARQVLMAPMLCRERDRFA